VPSPRLLFRLAPCFFDGLPSDNVPLLNEWRRWLVKYAQRLAMEGRSDAERQSEMRATSPKYIPREWYARRAHPPSRTHTLPPARACSDTTALLFFYFRILAEAYTAAEKVCTSSSTTTTSRPTPHNTTHNTHTLPPITSTTSLTPTGRFYHPSRATRHLLHTVG